MSDPQPLHRLFGSSWLDLFEGTAIAVETELDLSLKQQYLDLVLIRKAPGPIPRRPPDGFEDLAAHNLVTFKSHQEALDGWALCELIGHYVNYRKQSSPSLRELLPETDYRLFAVCARYPSKLAQTMELAPLSEGIYEARVAAVRIRVIVARQLPRVEHNAMLLLYSGHRELMRFAITHYRPHSQETSTLLITYLKALGEDPDMSDKLKEYARKAMDDLMKSLSPEERLKGLPAEERLKGLPAEERLKGLSIDELLRALSPEAREELARALKKPKANGSSPKPD